jgi:hypothetical protein
MNKLTIFLKILIVFTKYKTPHRTRFLKKLKGIRGLRLKY